MEEFLSDYMLLSIFMAIAITILKFVKNKPLTNNKDLREKAFAEDVKAGHLEKAVFGDRTVYYEKDLSGEGAVKAYNFVERLKKEHVVLYLVASFTVTFVTEIVVWPKTVSEIFTRRKAR